MNYTIGVDIGTTSTKAVLYDETGKVISYANEGYPLYQETPDMAEQDLTEIFQGVLTALRKVVAEGKIKKEQIKGVAFSAAMHSLIVLDKDMKPLTRLITWADNRAEKHSEILKNSSLGEKIYRTTGTPIHPMSPLTKIIWLQQEQPEIFHQARYFVGIKEYVLYELFGELKIDQSIASATGLLDIFNLTWDQKALSAAGITAEFLPEIVTTDYQFHGLKKNYADLIGLSAETPFIIGASDGVLSNLGVDAVKPGVAALTIGTSGAIRTVVDHPVTDPKGRLFCYVLSEGKYVLGGSVNNGGIVFRWVRDQLFAPEKATAQQLQTDSYEALNQLANQIAAGSDGLIFLPYLGGERAPLWDANARGTYFGLNRNHTRPHMLRAALEGIIFNLYTVLMALEEVAGPIEKIQASGGFARSELWCQILADIFEMEITIPESFESSCLGAAVLGMKSIGLVEDLSVIKEMMGETQTHQPDSANYAAYRELLPIFISLTSKLKNEFQEIADYQRKH